MHASALSFAQRHLQDASPKGVVEFGSRNVNGSIREWVHHSFAYTGVDIKPGPDVDVVMDAAEYLADPVDLVICMETLEHAPNWADIVHAASRNLNPGGWFLMTCASTGRAPHSAKDGGPLRSGEYYENVSPVSFEKAALAAGLRTVALEYKARLGDLYYLGEKI
jgi:SAM-dependent methyltransferase